MMWPWRIPSRGQEVSHGTSRSGCVGHLEREHSISRRTLQRARAKLTRLGLIEHVSFLNARYGGQHGWKLSSRMSTALRQLADKIDDWRRDMRPERREKDERLVGVLG